jgi:hypothetical protein
VLACLALSSCGIPGSIVMWAETKQYSGDGVIQTCSNLLAGGYKIDFPRFDASLPYAASYHLAHVPPTGREPAVIYLRFDAPDLSYLGAEKKKKSVTATFRFTLYDAKGKILHSAEFLVSDSTWTSNRSMFGVYELEKSFLHFERNASYALNVSYTPGSVPPPAKQLYFAIDNCAFY